MSDKQIQPVRRGPYQITQRVRPRSLMGQVSLVLLQPGYFFRTLPQMSDTRSWLWAAVLILALLGIVAVRQQSLQGGTSGGADFSNFGGGALPGTDLGGAEAGPIGGDFGGVPGRGGPVDPGIGSPAPVGAPGGSGNVTGTWTTALLTGAGALVGWLILTLLLAEVSLFNGRKPAFGHNFQIAIWASMPLALMAVLQLIFYAGGGTVGESGLAGLLNEWDAYNSLPPLLRDLILSLTSRLTVFWLWSLILIYVGARGALNGKTWASGLVVVAWVALIVIAPVVTGAVKAPEVSSQSNDSGGDFVFEPDSTEEAPQDVEILRPAPEVFNNRGEPAAEATSVITERVPSGRRPSSEATAEADIVIEDANEGDLTVVTEEAGT